MADRAAPRLAIPAAAVSGSLAGLLVLVAVFGWFASLVLGRMPRGLRHLGGYVLRYNAQVAANGSLLLTDRYPHSSPAADGGVVAQGALAEPARAL